MKLNDKLMLGFQENQSFLFVMLRNYQFMYTARDLLKAERKRGEEDAVRGGLNPLSGFVKLLIHLVRGILHWSGKS